MYTPEEQFLYQTKNIYDQLLKYKKIYPIIFPIINNTKLEKSLNELSNKIFNYKIDQINFPVFDYKLIDFIDINYKLIHIPEYEIKKNQYKKFNKPLTDEQIEEFNPQDISNRYNVYGFSIYSLIFYIKNKKLFIKNPQKHNIDIKKTNNRINQIIFANGNEINFDDNLISIKDKNLGKIFILSIIINDNITLELKNII